MKGKIRWYSILPIGLVLLLTSSVIGCGESYTQEDLDAAYETGHAEGYDDGSHAGYKVGYTEGCDTGKAEGYEAGSLEGYKVGYAEGKDAGLAELESAKQGAEKLGYDKGYKDGLAQVQLTEGKLSVHFIDVGQGDAILIDLGETEILIDGGGKSPGVTAYLNDCVDDRVLEVMIATHPHADHIGGLIDVLAEFEVKEVWHNGDTRSTQTYSQFMSAVNSEGAQVYEARRGDTIESDELVFNVLHPVNLDDTVNNNSIVLSLSYGEVDFLFMGDAEKEAEANMLESGVVPNAEILKVGHHGSRTASSRQFLQVAKPEQAIYMAGEGNSYGHPHQETLIALNEVHTVIYGTDVNGTIVITTDGQGIYSPEYHPTTPDPVTQPQEEPQIIEDLAYISTAVTTYTNDADPEADGIDIWIYYFNSGSGFIYFQNIPIKVSVKLFGYRNWQDSLRDENRELVYQEEFTVYQGGYAGSGIEIPFEVIAIDQNKYYHMGNMEVTVTTPEQGDFHATSPFGIRLYDEKIIEEENLSLEIVSVTSPIEKGYTATLQAKTVPGAQCTITVFYKSGPSSASGLDGKTADNEGNVSWSWKVGTRTTPGSWRIVVTASLDGETISQTTDFTVY